MSSAAKARFAKRDFLLARDALDSFIELLHVETSAGLVYLYRYESSRERLTLTAHSSAVSPDHAGTESGSCHLSETGIWADCIRQQRPVFHEAYPVSAASPVPGVDIGLESHVGFPVFEGVEPVAVIGIVGAAEMSDDERVETLKERLQLLWGTLQAKLRVIEERKVRGDSAAGSESSQDMLVRMVAAISGALEAREQHASLHQQNVAYLCDLLAREIALTAFERRGLLIAASLHDIGKIAVPEAILAKPGRVSATEFSVLQTHAEIGADLFRPLDLPWPVADMIAQHHERLDGSGYPGSLHRNDICEGARMIAIADTYDAMATERPYRRARSTADALAALMDGRGQLYDAYLVDAFSRCVGREPCAGGRYSAG